MFAVNSVDRWHNRQGAGDRSPALSLCIRTQNASKDDRRTGRQQENRKAAREPQGNERTARQAGTLKDGVEAEKTIGAIEGNRKAERRLESRRDGKKERVRAGA